MNAQFKKGVLDLVLLHLVHENPVSAYDVLLQISDGLNVNENTIYPLLRRLEKEGYLSHKRAQGDMGAPKKVFLLTEDGHKRHEELMAAWISFQREVSYLLGGS